MMIWVYVCASLTVGGCEVTQEVTATGMRRERAERTGRVRRVRDGARHV